MTEQQPPRPPRSSDQAVLRDALARLLEGEGGPQAQELADVLWIARVAGLVAPEVDAPVDTGRDPDVKRSVEPKALPSGPVDLVDPPQKPVAPPPDPSVELHPRGGGGGKPAEPARHGMPVQVTRPAALPGALALARALRPLRHPLRARRSGTRRLVLDEQATAEATADLGMLLPVWQPDRGPRFSVDLVVDSGATMAVWHSLAGELATLLERHGAFAQVCCWSLDTDRPVPRLTRFERRRRRVGASGPTGAAEWSRPLRGGDGSGILLVLTDGVGPAWYGEELPGFLARAAAERPAAALQVLPRRLWHRTALHTAPVEARPVGDGRPVFRAVGPHPAVPRAGAPVSWLPVLEIHPDWLAPWAELVAGRSAGWTPMLAAPLGGPGRPLRRAEVPLEALTAPELVARFRAGSSAEAYRLACHLAAAPLSLPVMRLVQQAAVPDSGQTDLAELFLSGLLERRAGASDPDEVVYDFRDGVRDELLAELTRSESVRVLERVLAKVSGRVAATFGGTLDFRALAAALGGADGVPLPERSLPFAEVAVAVLAGAGGRYAAVARELGAGAASGSGVAERPAVLRRELLNPVRPVLSPPELPYMIGRRNELQAIQWALDPRRPLAGEVPVLVVVEGEPGMGRRRLVQEYAERHGARHSFVHWIDARWPDSVQTGLERLWAALAPEGAASYDGATLAAQLRRHQDWLVILDWARWPDLLDVRSAFGELLKDSGATGNVIAMVDPPSTPTGVGSRVVITLDMLTDEDVLDTLRTRLGAAYDPYDERQAEQLRILAQGLPRFPDAYRGVDLDAALAVIVGSGETPPAGAADARVVGGRRLLRQIRQDATGTVWQAGEADSAAAVKIFDGVAVPYSADSFRRQVEGLQRLFHRGIVMTYGSGTVGGYHYLVTEFFEGGDLQSALEASPGGLPVAAGIALARSVAAGLEYLHGNDIVHRDLKPASIQLRWTGEGVLGDFGIDLVDERVALPVDGATPTALARPHGPAPAYMSPGQARGKVPAPSSDLYALGCVLYEVFTGRPPFSGAPDVLKRHHIASSPLPPRQLRPELPEPLEALILDLLAKRANDRPSDAAEVIRRLSATDDWVSTAPRAAGRVRFSLLGEVRAWRGDEPIDLGSPERQRVLVLLLDAAGRPRSLAELAEAVWWPDHRPSHAEASVRVMIRRLHDSLTSEPGSGVRLVVDRSGAVLEVAADAVDVNEFERAHSEALVHSGAGNWPRARESAARALDLWGGTPLAGLSGPAIERLRSELLEWHLSVLEIRLEADVELGRPEQVLDELTTLAAEHPSRERLTCLLMSALDRCGRRAEALSVYARAARFLQDELGTTPGADLVATRNRIRAGAPAQSTSGSPQADPSPRPAGPRSNAEGLRFEVLGPMRAWRGDQPVPLGTPQQQMVLVVLLLNRGQPVETRTLIEALWGDSPPPQAPAALRTYVSRLRAVLEPGQEATVLQSVGDGYLLDVGAESSDLAAFEAGVAEAAATRATGELVVAEQVLRNALARWHGTPLSGVTGPYAEAQRRTLTEQRITATEQLHELSLDLGRHEEAVSDLEALVIAAPARERPRELLVLALYRCGRRHDALAQCRTARSFLADSWDRTMGLALIGLALLITADDHIALRGSVADVRRRSVASVPALQGPERRGHPRLAGGQVVPAGERRSDKDLAFAVTRNMVMPVFANFEEEPFLLVFGERGAGKTALLRMLIQRITERYTPDQAGLVVLDFRRSLLDVVPREYLAGYTYAPSEVSHLVGHLHEICDARLARADGASDGRVMFLIIDDYELLERSALLGPTPLAGFLLSARRVGLRVILARDMAGADTRGLSTPFLQRLRAICNQAVLLSGDPDEGRLLGLATPRRLPPGQGVFVSPTTPEGALIKIDWLPPS